MRTLAARLPELAIIDIGLGADVDGGFDLCRELRAAGVGVIIRSLCTRESYIAVVAGLMKNTDDYLAKDVSLPHLLARIAALFRRVDAAAQPAAGEDVMHRGPLALDARRMTATWKGHALGLTVTEEL